MKPFQRFLLLFTESNQRAAHRAADERMKEWMNEWKRPTCCTMMAGLKGGEGCVVANNRKHVKDQMPATTGNQRRRHTARHLLPFRGSCRGSAGFIMDVMESRPRSERNHHSDTSPSRQRFSSEHRRRWKSCLTHNNKRRWRPKAMSQATPPSITVQRTCKRAFSWQKIGPVSVQNSGASCQRAKSSKWSWVWTCCRTWHMSKPAAEAQSQE